MSADTASMFVYFSSLLDRPVFDAAGSLVGEVYDIIVKPTAVYPQSAGLIIRKGFPNRLYASVAWAEIEELARKRVTLKLAGDKLSFAQKHDNKEELTLRRDILDQQVVDTANHKVIRVNDVHMLVVDRHLMVAHVDISLRGLLRRLGFEKAADMLVRFVNPRAEYLSHEHLISWKHIQPLSINPVSMTIKVNFPQTQLSTIPAADLGEIFLDLNLTQQVALFKSLDIKSRARIFTNIDFKAQESLLEEIGLKDGADVISNMPPDEATDFLERLPKSQTQKLLAQIESKQAKKLSELLGYSSDSAGGLMTTEYMAFSYDTPVENVIKQIRERQFKVEPAQFVYLVDDKNRLKGSTNFRRLLTAQPQDPLKNAAFPKTKYVHLTSSVKEVAYLMEKYKYYALPVVDDQDVLQGIITVDDILSQVIAIAWRRLSRRGVLHSAGETV